MRIFVLGATGQTGREVVRIALERGWDVTAAVRDPSKLWDLVQSQGGDKLKVEKADIFSSSSMFPIMRGCDCVISCLGSSSKSSLLPWTHVTFYSESIKQITAAMKEAGVTRILAVTSWCTIYDKDHPKMLEWFLKPLFLGRILADMGRMEDLWAQEPDIQYTSVKPPGLNNKPPTGTVIVTEGQFHPEASFEISRTDVATWMLDNIDNEE